jgi:hypothetical protein
MSDNQPTVNHKLRIGILIDTEDTEAWISEIIRRIRHSEYGLLQVLIKNKSGVSSGSPKPTSLDRFSSLLFNLYLSLDRYVYSSTPDARTTTNISAIIGGIHQIEVEPIYKNGCDHIASADIDTIQSFKLDVIIKFGFRRLAGEILTHASKYGVWGFENCDPIHSDMTTGNFRDVMERRGATITELKKFSNDKNDVVLYRSFSMTNHTSVNRNSNGVLWKSVTFLPRVLREIALFGEARFFKRINDLSTQPSQTDRYNPFVLTNIKTMNLILTFWLFKILKKIRTFMTIEQWIILFDFRTQGLSIDPQQFNEIKPPNDRFWADPHVIFHNDNYYVFIEELIYKNKRAHLSVFAIDKNGNYGKPELVMEKPFHLSYPFVFKHGEDYFMIPETSEHRTIELYRCTRFPDQWEFVMNLMEDVEAVDATLLFRDNIWWMFVNMREHPGASFSDDLFLFSSNNLLSNLWIPHPMNPIVSDVRHARSAGKIFNYNDTLYRPAQDCSVRYGHKVIFHEIITLNASEYEERIVHTIEPTWHAHILGTHTFNSEAGITVIDGEILRK